MKYIPNMSIVPIPLGKVIVRNIVQLIGFALTLIPSFLTKYIIDDMIGNDKPVPYFWIVLAIIFVFIIHFFNFYFIGYKSQVFANELCECYGSLTGQKIGTSDTPSYEAVSKSKILNIFNTDISAIYTMSNYLICMPSNLIKVLVVFILLFCTNYTLAFLALAFAPLYVLSSYTNKNKLAQLVSNERETADVFMQETEVLINNKASICLHKAFPYLFRKFEKSKKDFFVARNRQHFYLLITQELPRLITTLAPVLFLIIGGNFVIKKSMTLGTLILVTQLVGLVFEPLTNIRSAFGFHEQKTRVSTCERLHVPP